jgi:hypothetical protein
MRAIAGADLDDDGDIDLIGGGMDSVLYMLFNDGSAGFNDTAKIRLDAHILDIVTEDLNVDGFGDVVVGTGNEILVFFSNGDGTLQEPVAAGKYYYAASFSKLTTADMDQDGYMDIIGLGEGNDIITVISNNGDGTFAGELSYPGGSTAHFLATADFNMDSHIDVATLGDVLGGPDGAKEITFRFNTGNTAVGCADLNDFDLDGIGNLCDNCQLVENLDQADANHDGIGDACQFSALTEIGSNVELLFDLGFYLNFDSVSASGTTTIDIVSSGPPSDGTFNIVPETVPGYIQISSDAAFTGQVEICIEYPNNFTQPEEEQDLMLLHYNGGIWDTITTSHDTTNNKICGVMDGFSPFVMAIPSASCCVGTAGDFNGDGQEATILDVTYLVDGIFRGGPDPECMDETDVNSDGQQATILDLTFLIDDIFRGGPAPPACP